MLEIIYYLYLSCAEGKVDSGWHDQNYRLKWIMSGDNGAAVNILAIFQLFRSTAWTAANFSTKCPSCFLYNCFGLFQEQIPSKYILQSHQVWKFKILS